MQELNVVHVQIIDTIMFIFYKAIMDICMLGDGWLVLAKMPLFTTIFIVDILKSYTEINVWYSGLNWNP